jgi:fibronectin-binding autotransporter adhesin
LILNGATVNSVANVILANTSATNDLTIANTPAGSGVQTMGLRLGNAANTILVNSGRTITINDVISGAFFNNQSIASSIAVQGGGTVVFGRTNAFTGAVSVTGGSTLSVSSDQNFGQKVASSQVNLNNGTLLASSSFTLDPSRPIFVGDATTANGSGTISVAASQTMTYNGVIQNAGTQPEQLIKTGAGALQLGGTNTYTGGTTISGGTLQATANNVFASAGAFTLANTSGVLFDLNNTNQTIGSLAGGGTTGGNVSLGSGTLTTGGNNSSTTYAGAIDGTGGLTKTGTGSMILTAANTYTGGTTINAGTVLVNSQTGTQSGTGTGTVAVASGATLGGNGQAAGAVTVSSGGRVIGGQGTAVNEQLALGNNLTLANNSTIRIAVGNGATANDTSLAGSSQVAVTGVLGRATAADRITIDLAFATGGNLDLTGGTTYTRRVATYGSLSNLTPGSYTAANNVFNVTSPSFGVDPGWTVLVGQNGSALDVVFTPVPEPGAILAIGLAGLGLVGLVRRSRRGGAAPLS